MLIARLSIFNLLIGCLLVFATVGCNTPRWDVVEGKGPKTIREEIAESPRRLRVYKACAYGDIEKLRERSFAAITITLSKGPWTIDYINTKKLQVMAHACLRNNSADCARVEFIATRSGRVGAVTIPGHPVRENLKDDVKRWLAILEQQFGKYKCYKDELLVEELENYGIVIEKLEVPSALPSDSPSAVDAGTVLESPSSE